MHVPGGFGGLYIWHAFVTGAITGFADMDPHGSVVKWPRGHFAAFGEIHFSGKTVSVGPSDTSSTVFSGSGYTGDYFTLTVRASPYLLVGEGWISRKLDQGDDALWTAAGLVQGGISLETASTRLKSWSNTRFVGRINRKGWGFQGQSEK
jgi:hypothetical protein